ncbi:MAG: hypothetical protein OEV35_00550, partial [Gallionellaceae bacterium]|nr:hypothetical protein [Gallionellaceae bacterium]
MTGKQTSQKLEGQLLWFGTFLLCTLIIGLVALTIKQGKDRELDVAVASAANNGRIIEESLAGDIALIDFALRITADEIEHQETRHGFNKRELIEFLARQDKRIPEMIGLRVAGPDGAVRFAIHGVQVSNANLADRSYFIRSRDDPQAGLVISSPLFGRLAQKPVIVLNRRINKPDGSFAGIVLAPVAIEHILKKFAKFDVGPNGVIGLWQSPAISVAHHAPGNLVKEAAAPPEELRKLLEERPSSRDYRALDDMDKMQRIYHFRQVGKYPLFLVVGLAEKDILAKQNK